MTRPGDPSAAERPPAKHALLACVLLAAASLACSAGAGETPPTGEAARTCLRINDNPIEGDWDERARIRETWVAACRQAAAAEPANLRLKHVLARSLMATGRRDEAIVIWRELAEHDDADAAFEIYDMYKSYYRGDVNAPQLVTRAEAERALRRAAELGHAYATLMLAVLLDRGGTVKRDPQEAIRFAERAVANPSKDVTAADMQVLLGRLLVKSSDPEQKARGIALLEKLAQAGQWNAKAELAIAIRERDPARARALLEQSLRGNGGGAIPPLADMLIKGEGGPADPRRAVALLNDRRYSDVPGIRGARRRTLHRRQTGAARSQERRRPPEHLRAMGLRRAAPPAEASRRQSRSHHRLSGKHPLRRDRSGRARRARRHGGTDRSQALAE